MKKKNGFYVEDTTSKYGYRFIEGSLMDHFDGCNDSIELSRPINTAAKKTLRMKNKKINRGRKRSHNIQSTVITQIAEQWEKDAKLFRVLCQFDKADCVEQCARQLRAL